MVGSLDKSLGICIAARRAAAGLGNEPTAPAVLRGLQRYDTINLINTAGTILSAAATVVVLLLGGGVLGLVGVSIAVTLAMQAWAIGSIHRIMPELHFGWRGARRRLVRTVISFSSPCCLPLIPGYLSYVSGLPVSDLGSREARAVTLRAALLNPTGHATE